MESRFNRMRAVRSFTRPLYANHRYFEACSLPSSALALSKQLAWHTVYSRFERCQVMDPSQPPPSNPSLRLAGVPVNTANQLVLDYIEATFNAIIREIRQPSGQGKPVIALNRIVAVKPFFDEDDPTHLSWHIESREVKYHFPGQSKSEAWRFGK